jgi:anti-sigma regulatory factor (Ser/Thr protein kinase)
LLLTSELVTNAVRYGDTTEVVMTVECGPALVRIAVADNSPRRPHIADVPIDGVGGRGIRMVAGMASGWGVTPTTDRDGKAVWFRLDL